MYQRVAVVGGAYVAPAVTTPTVYPIRGGGFYPALCLAVFELLLFL